MYAFMVTPNAFPNGDAGSVRDYSFACIYKDLGYDVVHFGKGEEPCGSYRGIEYRSLRVNADSVFDKLRRKFAAFGVFKAAYDCLVAKRGYPSMIHLYDVDEKIFRFLVAEARRLSIPVLHDSVEWYSPCQFRLGCLDYRYILKDRLNTHVVSSPVKVIAISEFLGEFFSSKGLCTTVVPVIMDSEDYHAVPSGGDGDKLKFMYAGSPASKDYLSACVRGFASVPNNVRARMRLDVYGATAEDIAVFFDGGSIPAGIFAHGRVSREKVLEALGRADFSMLLRPEDERYARAGFPTKAVEAMMCGCPMLCNLSSDLSKYLVDGENSMIVRGHTEKGVADALGRASRLSRNQIAEMKKNARRDAERFFDYRNYRDAVSHLINE